MQKRSLHIEFARICCALLVITTHVLNRFYLDESRNLRDSVCLLSTFCIVAVPCFLMITGFFSRKGQPWLPKLKKTFLSIVCPTFFVIILSVATFKWITHSASLRESILSADYRNILTACLSWQINSLPGCSHLWYIPALCRLMLIFPLLSYLCSEDKYATAARRGLYLLYALSVFWYDLQQIIHLPNVYFYNLIDSRILFFLLGYEFNTFDYTKLSVWIWSVITFVGCMLMYIMTRCQFAVTGSFTDFFYHYQTIPCMIASFGCFGFFLSLPIQNLSEKAKNCIFYLAKQTWYVYLLHVMVLNFFRSGKLGTYTSLPGLALLIFAVAIVSFLAAIFVNTMISLFRKRPSFAQT